MARGFEDLFEDILSHPGVQTTDVESSLVRLRGRPAHKPTRAGRRHHVPGHRRGDGGRDRVGILRNHHGRARRRRHVGRIRRSVTLRAIVMLSGGSRRSLRDVRGSRGGNVISHCEKTARWNIQRRRSVIQMLHRSVTIIRYNLFFPVLSQLVVFDQGKQGDGKARCL